MTWKMWKKVFVKWRWAINEVKIEYAISPVYELIDKGKLFDAKKLLKEIRNNKKIPQYPDHQYIRVTAIIERKQVLGK